MKLQLNDPGMPTLHLKVGSLDEMALLLHKYNQTYVSAYLTDEQGQLILNAHRELGVRNWHILLIGR